MICYLVIKRYAIKIIKINKNKYENFAFVCVIFAKYLRVVYVFCSFCDVNCGCDNYTCRDVLFFS